MLMAEAPLKQPVNIGVDIRKVSHNVAWYYGTKVDGKHFKFKYKHHQLSKDTSLLMSLSLGVDKMIFELF